jgi:DNA-binding transcriptional MerR regulator
MNERLEEMRGEKFVGVAELAIAVRQILAESGPSQEKATVTALPDERTVRFYLAEGLLSPAEEKQGTASVFGYKHLLQLLAVKKLQAEDLPIRKIKQLLDGLEEADLKKLLQVESKRAQKNEATKFLESLLTTSKLEDKALSGPLRQRSSPSLSKAIPPAASDFGSLASSAPEQLDSWVRIEVEQGVELHLRSGVQFSTERKGLQLFAEKIVRAVESYLSKAQAKKGK